MPNYSMKNMKYKTLQSIDPYQEPFSSEESDGEAPKYTFPTYYPDHDEANNFIVHVVPENRGTWTHIEDLDSFFVRMYQYYLKGGFSAMLIADCFQIFQYCFIIFFLTFLIYCVNYPVLFRNDVANPSVIAGNVTFSDVVYPTCSSKISFSWWLVLFVSSIIGLVKLARCVYNLYHAYDIKLFYNNALEIQDCDIGWISWTTVLTRVINAQKKLQMCIHKENITELDIYQRILRFKNYFIAMVNKKILPLYIKLPFCGDMPYLSKGLKYNLELLLFHNPWSPWENCWHLKDSFKDSSKRLMMAAELKKHITILALLNFALFPFIQAWQILYFFLNYAELIKRSPGSLGLRTWSLYSQMSLRHFNELDHELTERLHNAYKPAMKYLSSFPSPISTVIAKNVAFLSASILSVLIALSVYDEIVLTVEHMLTLITGLGVILAAARAFMVEEGSCQRSSEELLIQILGHVHYLPANWKGRAHTKNVANHFEQLFQFRAISLLMELFSPIVCPYILYSLRSRALDIVDFNRNFTVSILGIGDVCSFAQMDVDKHGNPDWHAEENIAEKLGSPNGTQLDQAEDGKTELSLVAFSSRNPGWRVPQPSQRRFLKSLRNGVLNATNIFLTGDHTSLNNNTCNSMLGSYYHQNNFVSNQFHYGPDYSLSHFRSRIMTQENIEEGENFEDEIAPNKKDVSGKIIPDKVDSLIQEEQEMSISALHLYDIHNNKKEQFSPRRHTYASTSRSNVHVSSSSVPTMPPSFPFSNEDTPLLHKFSS